MTRMQPAARGVLVIFGLSAFMLINGALCLLTDWWWGGPIVGWILVAIGLFLLVATLASYASVSRWNVKRKAGWIRLEVRVVIDHAAGERAKTLVDTADGKWRIALLNYPVELRDQIERDQQLEYIGELAHKKPLMLRPVGHKSEFLGYARSLESLRNAQ